MMRPRQNQGSDPTHQRHRSCNAPINRGSFHQLTNDAEMLRSRIGVRHLLLCPQPALDASNGCIAPTTTPTPTPTPTPTKPRIRLPPCPEEASRPIGLVSPVGTTQPPHFRSHALKRHRIPAQGANPGNSPGNILRVLKERRIVARLGPRPRLSALIPLSSLLFSHFKSQASGLRSLLSAFCFHQDPFLMS